MCGGLDLVDDTELVVDGGVGGETGVDELGMLEVVNLLELEAIVDELVYGP